MRHNNWQTRLSETINSLRNKEFDFPTWNCLFFSLQTVDAILETKLYNKYDKIAINGPQAAARNLRRYKFNTCQDLLLSELGGELKHISLAKIGDVVFIDKEREDLPVTQVEMFGPTPGICYGSTSFFVGEHDLVQVQTLTLDSALWVS